MHRDQHDECIKRDIKIKKFRLKIIGRAILIDSPCLTNNKKRTADQNSVHHDRPPTRHVLLEELNEPMKINGQLDQDFLSAELRMLLGKNEHRLIKGQDIIKG